MENGGDHPRGCSPAFLLLKLPPGDPLLQFSLGLKALHTPACPQGPDPGLEDSLLRAQSVSSLRSGFYALPPPVCMLGKWP